MCVEIVCVWSGIVCDRNVWEIFLFLFLFNSFNNNIDNLQLFSKFKVLLGGNWSTSIVYLVYSG